MWRKIDSSKRSLWISGAIFVVALVLYVGSLMWNRWAIERSVCTTLKSAQTSLERAESHGSTALSTIEKQRKEVETRVEQVRKETDSYSPADVVRELNALLDSDR